LNRFEIFGLTFAIDATRNPDDFRTRIASLYRTLTIMEISNLRELYVDELKDLYNAEHQLLKALPKMAKAATSVPLKKGFEKHFKETEEQVARLETIFEAMGKSPKGKKCKAMEGLIEEAKELLEEDMAGDVLDAALIASAQRVEHYEMAGYGCVRTYAALLGEKEAAKLLQQTLDEEGATDKALTTLSEKINVEADNEGEMDDEEEDETPKPRRKGRRKATAGST